MTYSEMDRVKQNRGHENSVIALIGTAFGLSFLGDCKCIAFSISYI